MTKLATLNHPGHSSNSANVWRLNGASEDKMCRDLSCSELDSEQERSLHVLSSDAPFS
jgi:hypothetical protein